MNPYPNATRGWRDAAADEVLAAEMADGYGEFALLKRLRGRLPGVCTLKVSIPDFDRYAAFLREETEDLHSVLRGAHEERRRNRIVPQLSWHTCKWRGAPIELVVLPDSHQDFALAVGGSAEVGSQTLRSFAKELSDYCKRPAGRSLAYSSGTWRASRSLDSEIGKVSWSDVVLPEAQKDEIRATVEGFFSRRDAYRSLGFAWRRGVLLVGPPGTGKTMICKAVAASLEGLPFLYVRDLSGYDPEETLIGEVFSRARRLAPCVLVFEDIDGFVDDNNRAVFLNELDGFENNDGMLVLASSNNPERIDEALLRRPSRFDRVFRIGLPGEAERRRYCLELLSRSGVLGNAGGGPHLLNAGELAADVARASGGFAPAYLKEAFLGAALERAHEGTIVRDEAYARAVLEHVEKLKRYMSESRNPEKLAEARGDSPPGFGLSSSTVPKMM